MVFYTDGLTEAMNEEGEEFTLERFLKVLENSRHRSLEDLVDSVFYEVDQFNGDKPPHDDVTLVTIRVRTPAAQP